MVDSWDVIARVGGIKAEEGLCGRLCRVRGVLNVVSCAVVVGEEIVNAVEAGEGGRLDFADE